MSQIPGTNLAAMVVPFDTADIYATHNDKYGRGGFRVCDLMTDRDAITALRRKAGMWVKVIETGKVYELGAGETNADWAEVVTAGTAPVVSTITGLMATPFTGVSRRYFFAARTFNAQTISASSAPATNATVTVNKNGGAVCAVVLPAGQMHVKDTQSFSVADGDYLTVDITGGVVADVVLELI